ncbi:MAG: hypothetical protein PVJ39_00180 [Gammaproteobacteria bacterium]|jgi:hypothetical protein
MQNNKKLTMMYRPTVNNILLRFLLLLCFSTAATASTLSDYKRLAEDTIRKAQTGNISDIDQLIAQQSRLIQLGVKACEEYAHTNPESQKILNLVISNVEVMKQLTLAEIEEKWHNGSELKKVGYTVKDDHFGTVGNIIDAVIHPATSYIALNNYKGDGDNRHLQQVIAELSEVLLHLHHLE